MPKEISLESLYPGKMQNTVDLFDVMQPASLVMDKELTNGVVSIKVSNDGAELTSIKNVATRREYLWQADPKYWKRHSPVLFPIVGSVWDGEYRSKGQKGLLQPGETWEVKTFKLGQHGFARDMVFQLIDDEPDAEGNPQLLYVLRSSEETLKKYPYRFRLEIGYRLIENAVEVIWRVMNPSRDEDLKFQIGAHPAFYWPLFSNEDIAAGVEQQDKVLAQSRARGFFRLYGPEGKLLSNAELKKSVITEKGCVDPAQSQTFLLDSEGMLPLFADGEDLPPMRGAECGPTFAKDALVLENNQVHTVSLCGQDGKAYLTLKSEAPLMGLWSPPGKNAPFVCIEPWYGRCDRVHFAGTYEEKDWVQTLAPLATFEARYQIVLE